MIHKIKKHKHYREDWIDCSHKPNKYETHHFVFNRYIEIRAKLKTWTEVEGNILFNTETDQFEIPSNYQIDTKVLGWKYLDD